VRAVAGAAVLAITAGALVHVASGQEPRPFWLIGDHFPPFYERRASGQNIAPAFEGWEQNPDGTFTMLFGYFNRNWEEQPDIPIGPDNNVEPGGPDQGQPTHFFPRRNKLVFRVRVPKDFGNKDLVWTLTVNGKTERAYGTLKPDYIIEKRVLQIIAATSLRGVRDDAVVLANTPPVVQLAGESRRTVKVGEPLELSAVVTDDGIYKPLPLGKGPNVSDNTAMGLRVAWLVYRGRAAAVTFSPEQFKVYQDKQPGTNSPWSPGWAPPPIPADGRFPVTVRFSAPGAYVIRLLAHDGGLDTTKDVTVAVQP
jgi:hypothetical protein